MTPEQQQALEELKSSRKVETTTKDDSFDIDDALDALEQEADMQAEPPVDTLYSQTMQFLFTLPDGPSEEVINGWKLQYGDEGVMAIALDSKNVFVFTFLNARTWERVQSMRESADLEMNTKIRNAVLQEAVLYPIMDKTYIDSDKCRSGVPETLFNLIMQHSYHLTLPQAIQLTVAL